LSATAFVDEHKYDLVVLASAAVAAAGVPAEDYTVVTRSNGDSQLLEVLVDFEQRASGAKRIMGARLDEQEAYEHALQVYTRQRDKMESKTGSMWGSNPADSMSHDVGEATRGQDGHGVEELYRSVTDAASALSIARKKYEHVAVATTDELRRLRSEMHTETAAALCAVAKENARHHAARAAAWSSIAAQCDSYATRSSSKRASTAASSGGGGVTSGDSSRNLASSALSDGDL
jgi:hypothetical protein